MLVVPRGKFLFDEMRKIGSSSAVEAEDTMLELVIRGCGFPNEWGPVTIAFESSGMSIAPTDSKSSKMDPGAEIFQQRRLFRFL